MGINWILKSFPNSILNQSLAPTQILISVDSPICSDLDHYLTNFEYRLPLVLFVVVVIIVLGLLVILQ